MTSIAPRSICRRVASSNHRPVADRGQRELLLADDDQVGRSIGLIQHRRPVLADQLRGVALGHAGQLADKGDPLVAEKFGDVVVGSHRVGIT